MTKIMLMIKGKNLHLIYVIASLNLITILSYIPIIDGDFNLTEFKLSMFVVFPIYVLIKFMSLISVNDKDYSS